MQRQPAARRRQAPARTTSPRLERLSVALAELPYMTPEQGRRVYDHVRATRPLAVLELGTGHGVSAAYIAAGLADNDAGRLTTVDFERSGYSPDPESVLARAGVADRVTVVRRYSSYTWWLKKRIEACSDPHGNCEPSYDFIYIDGAKNWNIDGLAVVLAEKLLRQDGWLLLDDLGWTYDLDPERTATDGIVHRELSSSERREPHMRAVWDLLVCQHPAFTELIVQDDWWGWAHKAPGEPRRLAVEASRPLGAVISGAARTLRRRAAKRARRVRWNLRRLWPER
jgi:predicted O-methyltransferase YrrM